MKASVLGCGRWGSFLAWYMDHIGHKVMLWGRSESANVQSLMASRRNDILSLPESITLTTDLDEAVNYADHLFISISAQQLRSFIEQLCTYPLEGKTLILCMKGLEKDTGKRLSEVVAEYIPPTTHIAIWVGPGHPQDFVKNIPNCMVIDSLNQRVKKRLVRELSSDLIRFYYGNDMIGNEIGAAAKNVVGIAAGMLDGKGLSSLKGALMSRGAFEISRLIQAMGGKATSAYGLAHLGDYEATVFSPYSHNRMFGELFVQGKAYDKLSEGVSTSRALVDLGEKLELDLPIATAVHSIVNLGKSPERILDSLFSRMLKDEFYLK